MRLIIGCAIAAGAVVAGTNVAVVSTSQPRIVDAQEAAEFGADAIVVLGASVYADGTPSGILEDRLDDAISLYEAGVAPLIVMSGDGGTASYNEPEAMRAYAIANGVPASAIMCDDGGFSTYETMYNMRNVFGFERIVVATQTYHLYRALYVANGLGVEAVGVASDYHAYDGQASYDVREIPARTKDFFQTLFKVSPSSAAAISSAADVLEGVSAGRG